jgi:hypothetical protein
MLTITGPNGDSITVEDRPGGKRRVLIEGGKGQPAGGELLLDAESAREVGMALGAHPLDNELRYNEETLMKVRAGILAARPFLTERAVTDIIAGMQNAGILFRERA